MIESDRIMRSPSVDSPAFTAAHASSYVEGTLRKVPGLAALHRMTSMLVAERAPVQARVLVLGAGGGMELKALADDNSGWSFCGIDPSADMLRVAVQTVGPHLPRVHLQQGYIDAAPEGPFDAAVCLLTLHFVGRAQASTHSNRFAAAWYPRSVRRRAYQFPQSEPERSTWIARHVAFGGAASGDAESARQAIATKLSVLSPEEDEAVLRKAGFSDVRLFYAAMTFRGWVGYA
ncbi:methyltransferase [Sinorhizobium meliloti CCBAU 01290]|nr:methyltransferase [Sinorhizobium meliloti CCBAU 01290]